MSPPRIDGGATNEPGRAPQAKASLGAVRSGARTRTEGPARTSAQSPAPRRVPNAVVTASAPGQVWAIDVQFDSDRKGSVIKTCHAIDAFTR